MTSISQKDRVSVIENLKSTDEALVLKAIDKLKKGGDASFVPEILRALIATTDPVIEASLPQFLYDVKDAKAMEALVDLMADEEFKPVRVQMLTACWQCGLDLSHRLPALVPILAEGDYLECLEVLTIVENWDAIPDRKMLSEQIEQIKDDLSQAEMTETEELIWAVIDQLQRFAQ
jgi:hypothetical protein